MRDDVRLIINGNEFGGWKEASITAGIERQVRDFTLSVTDKWPGSIDVSRRVSPGDACEVWIGEDKMLTGYVDGTPIHYDKSGVSVSVKGRSKTADLVDCSATNSPGQWHYTKLEVIAAALAAPYGITVITQVNTGAPIQGYKINIGESAFESIDNLLKQRYVLATDNADGDLVFIKMGTVRATTNLVLGQNIILASTDFDYKERYSVYAVKAQTQWLDSDQNATSVSQIAAKKTDPIITRNRVLIINQDGLADQGLCAARAAYEVAHRASKSLMTSYTVQGWRQGDGALWVPNILVHVTDPIIGFDMDMLIAEVNYRLSEDGMLTTLKVAPPEGFIQMPPKKMTDLQSWSEVR